VTDSAKTALTSCIEDAESSYEFMLAYAAQGRDSEGGGGPGLSIRDELSRLSNSLGEIEEKFRAAAQNTAVIDAERCETMLSILAQDAIRAQAAVDLVLSLPSIGSQIVDNLNASIHLRTLLTTVFLIDEALNSFQDKS